MKVQELRDFKKEAVRIAFSKIYQAVKRNGDLDKVKIDIVTNSVHSYLTLLSLGNINEKIGAGLGPYVSNFFDSLNPSISYKQYLGLNRSVVANNEFSQYCYELSDIEPEYFPADAAFKDLIKNEALNFFKNSAENFVNKTLLLTSSDLNEDSNLRILAQNSMIGDSLVKAFAPNDLSLVYVKGLDVRDIRKFLEDNPALDIVDYGTRKTFKRIFEKTKDDDLELEF